MKKLFILLPLLFLVGCAPEAKPALPELDEHYTATLTADLSTLTADDSTAVINVTVPSKEDSTVTYAFEIGYPCYIKTTPGGKHEIILKDNAYIKSISEYKVERLVIDFYNGQGENHAVHAPMDSTAKVEPHESTITPTEPKDNGVVHEYEINQTSWKVDRVDRKPGLYYISVLFVK